MKKQYPQQTKRNHDGGGEKTLQTGGKRDFLINMVYRKEGVNIEEHQNLPTCKGGELFTPTKGKKKQLSLKKVGKQKKGRRKTDI